ncbi:MAG TPA: O-methyltransferase [Candidatus Dormibacteraeota bacterium]|nr:O-methyltransferase [Candidatus Dormibacteraeota bacterium]
MNDDRWDAVDAYTTGLLQPADPVLEAAVKEAAGLPNIAVSAAQGQFLHLLARAIRARRILEIGTLGGYSAIWLGRALPDDGRLITLELEERHAEVARRNFARAGLEGKIEVRVGPALESLAGLRADRGEPFDLVFIDADKRNTPTYFSAAVDLAHAGSLVVVDNVVRKGKLIDTESEDPDAEGMRRLIEQMGADRRVVPAVIQTVGVKGWDGFAFALVVES